MLKRLLPMAGHTRGNRSAVTCELKCGNACAHPVPNASGNPHFRDLAEAAISRRAALGLSGGVAAAVVLANAPEARAASRCRALAGLRDPTYCTSAASTGRRSTRTSSDP